MHSIDATAAGASPSGPPADGGPAAPARVAADSFLTLRYRLSGPDGEAVVDTFGGAPATLSLGTGELAPALEAHLIGLVAGDRRTFALAPGEAFGARSEALVHRVARAALAQATGEPDETYAAGDVVRLPAPDGASSIAGIVRAIEGSAGSAAGETVVLDLNHPLAGRAATFEVDVLAVL